MNNKVKNCVTVIVLGLLMFSMALWCWLKAPTAFSDSERRALAQLPELSGKELLNGNFMKNFETYTQDQFPMRDGFRTLKSFAALRLFNLNDTNGLFVESGHVAKIEYPLDEAMLQNAVNRFDFIKEQFLSDEDSTYLCVVPEKNYYIDSYPYLDLDEIADYMALNAPWMEQIDIRDALTLDNYYRTDSHWKQETIFPVAQILADRLGVSISNNFTENTLERPFTGVYAQQIALPFKSDTIKYLTSEVLDNVTVTSYDTGMPVKTSVYDMEGAMGKDPYDIFLGGADPLIVIENPNCEGDKELILFRDSFTSSLAPLLVEGYAKITIVDIRYVQSAFLGNLVDFEGAQDVLFIYSASMLNSSTAFK
ncbi:MAG: hypothetical protein IKM51_02605 [Oscillospiraceae bacterium]|nr:hypothetical protein [Oscillospiraceae bacterium]